MASVMAMTAAGSGGMRGLNESKGIPAPKSRAELKEAEAHLIAAYELTRPQAEGQWAWYVRVGDFAWHKIVKSKVFQECVTGAILVSCFYAGATTYSSINDAVWMASLDTSLALVFLAESAVKIVAEGPRPWMYFHGNPYWRWNIFDFSINLLTLPWISDGVPSALRKLGQLARVLRITKLLRKAKRLAIIVGALVSGLKSIALIFLLLFIVFVMYATVATIYLGKNDPWHFKSAHSSFVTMFAMLTMNDWSSVFYTSYYGCDVYNGKSRLPQLPL